MVVALVCVGEVTVGETITVATCTVCTTRLAVGGDHCGQASAGRRLGRECHRQRRCRGSCHGANKMPPSLKTTVLFAATGSKPKPAMVIVVAAMLARFAVLGCLRPGQDSGDLDRKRRYLTPLVVTIAVRLPTVSRLRRGESDSQRSRGGRSHCANRAVVEDNGVIRSDRVEANAGDCYRRGIGW